MGDDVTNDGYQGQANETTGSEEFNAFSFLVSQILNSKWTITVCQVKAVMGGGPTAAPAMVNVQPMVNQVDGQGQATAHGVINNIPVFRMQGGTSAIVADPSVGDIGLLACASRDISTVKSTQAAANPGSGRTFDPSDGLYIGGFLNKAPTQYIEISSEGINLVAAPGIMLTINAAGITLTSGANTLLIPKTGEIKLNGIAFSQHVHQVDTTPSHSGFPIEGP